MSAVDRLQAAWDLLAGQRAAQQAGIVDSPFQIQSAMARLFRARDILVPPGVGR